MCVFKYQYTYYVMVLSKINASCALIFDWVNTEGVSVCIPKSIHILCIDPVKIKTPCVLIFDWVNAEYVGVLILYRLSVCLLLLFF